MLTPQIDLLTQPQSGRENVFVKTDKRIGRSFAGAPVLDEPRRGLQPNEIEFHLVPEAQVIPDDQAAAGSIALMKAILHPKYLRND
jgi:hypothetical protein